MKKLLIISLVQIIACLAITAQETRKEQTTEFDVIVKENGEEMPNVKVLEITSAEIKYKKGSNPDGPTYSIAKSDVFMIKYANGEKEVFEQEVKPPVKTTTQTPVQTQTQTPEQTQTPVQTQTTPSQTSGVSALAAGQALTTTASNQGASSQSRPTQERSVREEPRFKRFQVGIATGIGVSGEAEGPDQVGLQATGRLRLYLAKRFAWDMLNVTYGANIRDHIEERVQIMSGFFAKTPGRTAYFWAARFGYGTGSINIPHTDESERYSGFSVEGETGFFIRNTFSISLLINYVGGSGKESLYYEYDYTNPSNVFVGLGLALYF